MIRSFCQLVEIENVCAVRVRAEPNEGGANSIFLMPMGKRYRFTI